MSDRFSASDAVSDAVAPSTDVAGAEFATRPILNNANVKAGTQTVQHVGADVSTTLGGTGASPVSIRDVMQAPVADVEAAAKGVY